MEDSRDKLDFDTKVIHAGQEPEEITGSVAPTWLKIIKRKGNNLLIMFKVNYIKTFPKVFFLLRRF